MGVSFPNLCSVLAEIHASFPGELSEHTEQTHTNITWLAASKNQTEVALFLLDQASRAGWSLQPGLVAVSCLPFPHLPLPCRMSLVRSRMHANPGSVISQQQQEALKQIACMRSARM